MPSINGAKNYFALIISSIVIVFLLFNEPLKLTVLCNRLHSIRYDRKNNIDYYYANTKKRPQQQQSNQRQVVTTNLKSILPANLAASPYSQASKSSEAELSLTMLNNGETSSLPQVAKVVNVVHGNGPRRTAKQVQGFNTNVDLSSDKSISTSSNINSSSSNNVYNDGQANVCLTAGCVKAAAEIIKNIDDRVDPCDDFYKYSCGNWIEAQVIPEDKTSVSLFSVVQDELDNKLRNLIEREASEQDAPIVTGMRNLYESCMNTSKYRCQYIVYIYHAEWD